MILLIDHFDSFVFNLAHYLIELNQAVQVIRQDKLTLSDIERFNPSHIVLSPGPCGPSEAEISMQIVNAYAGKIPFLGICLGHQIIGHVFGGKVEPARLPMHGEASVLSHSGTGIFTGLPNPCRVGRYHSLIVNETALSTDITIVARSEENEVMAMVSPHLKLAGVQFHPESVLTENGHQLIQNFLDGTLL